MKTRTLAVILLIAASSHLVSVSNAHATELTYDFRTGTFGSSLPFVEGYITFPMSSVGDQSFDIQSAVTFSFTLHNAPFEQTWTPSLFHNGVLEFDGDIGDDVLRGADLGTPGFQRWVMSTQGVDPSPVIFLVTGGVGVSEWRVSTIVPDFEFGGRAFGAWTLSRRLDAPEPSSAVLVAAALVGIVGRRRRRH